MTLREAVAHAKAQMIEHGKRHRAMSHEARALARQGRGGDTEVAHVALGELVVPRALQNSQVISAVGRAAAARGLPLSRLTVGGANSINPNTGAPEFGMLDGFSDWVSRRFGGSPSPSIPDVPSAMHAADRYDFNAIPGADEMKSAMDAQASGAAQMPIGIDELQPTQLPYPLSRRDVDARMEDQVNRHRTYPPGTQFMSAAEYRPTKPVGLWDSFTYGLKDPGAELVHIVPNVFSMSQEDADKRMNEREQEYEIGRDLAGRSGFDVPRFLGQAVATSSMGAPIEGLSMTKDFIQGAINGGAKGSLKPVPDSSEWEKPLNVAVGSIWGGVKGLGQGALKRGRF